MISRPVVLGLVAAACVTAAGAGAFVAVRQNGADRSAAAVTMPAQTGPAQTAPAQPVSETEALVAPPAPAAAAKPAEAPATETTSPVTQEQTSRKARSPDEACRDGPPSFSSAAQPYASTACGRAAGLPTECAGSGARA